MKKSSPGSTQLPTSRHLLSPSQPLIVTSVTRINRLWSPLAYGLGGNNRLWSPWGLRPSGAIIISIHLSDTRTLASSCLQINQGRRLVSELYSCHLFFYVCTVFTSQGGTRSASETHAKRQDLDTNNDFTLCVC